MKRALLVTAATMTLLLAGACSKQGTNQAYADNTMADNAMMANDMAMNGETNNSAMMGNNMAAPGMMTPQQFADTASASDAYEIASSKLAQTKSNSKAVKDFAAEMIKDHTKSTADLKAAAAKAAGNPTVTGQMTAEQQANLTALQGESGADFDSTYVSQQIDAHQKTLAALQSYAQNGDSPPLKDFASKATMMVQDHLDKAKKLTK